MTNVFELTPSPRRGGWTWGPVDGAKLRVLSMGAGVQSTTLALMAAHGEIGPMPDCAIFADTKAEPAAVYDQVTWLRSGNVLPFPIHDVSAGSLKTEIEEAAAGLNGMNARPPSVLAGSTASAPKTTRSTPSGRSSAICSAIVRASASLTHRWKSGLASAPTRW